MSFIPAELIKKKRDGGNHSKSELIFLINEFSKGHLPDYQMAAWLMATYCSGMSTEETSFLTEAMINSGERITFNDNIFPVDKHSTGGVGDKTSLILAPIAAVAGVSVPMISGRGLGHTGGTLDKLESIPGFNVNLDLLTFKKQVNEDGLCFIGQTEKICPADKKIYSLRDVTATVESLPLICASIMSKKIAEGIKALVLDIKFGSGAFMKTVEKAEELANNLMSIGRSHGIKTAAVLTDMNQPLGGFIGNALEVKECLEIMDNKKLLKNGRDYYEDTRSLSLELAGFMIWLGKKSKSFEEGLQIAQQILESGKALKKFNEVCKKQNGQLSRLPQPPHQQVIISPKKGYVSQFNTEKIGLCALILGAGRCQMVDTIDPVAGIELHKKIGDKVEKGEPLFSIFASTKKKFVEVEKTLLENIKIDEEQIKVGLLVRKRFFDGKLD